MRLPTFLTADDRGEILLTGHRIGLLQVIDAYNAGMSAEQLHDEFPDLPLDLIYQLLAYYHENRAEVDAYVARCHEEMERNYVDYRPGPGALKTRQLREKLQRVDAERASDPEWAALPFMERVRRLLEEMKAESA